ncbi:MAG: lytic murein transglycosylase B [Gammaproteobacteria bacterium RBG_16_51_14]|nr:MAG: lytic murein transglycosylase B [Gammaproteobacteria bacterium RBG_16_51_14]
MVRISGIFLLAISLPGSLCHAQILEQGNVTDFISRMEMAHGFDRNGLRELFSNIKISKAVLEAISRPAEKLPWYKYRLIFLQPDRIEQGVSFWQRYDQQIRDAEDRFGVPPEIIIAIIGVETQYGRNTGKYRVIDSLATLGFNYPERGGFFQSELEQYLLLTREQELDPLSITGSYAGAMGIPQFISSSYRNYAVDFDHDGHTDIWKNPVDAIGSVGNYFQQHGWRAGELIAIQAMVTGDRYKELITEDLEPNIDRKILKRYAINCREELSPDSMVKLIELETGNGYEFWLGMHNFYVITRYNHSSQYAMAVFQLAERIRESYAKQKMLMWNR